MRYFPGSIALMLLLAAGASPKTAQRLDSIRENLKEFRLQITLFDHDKSQDDRSIDLMLTEDDDANAEGLINHAQALRVFQVLVEDKFFDRAMEMDKTPWAPPEQPFYVVWVRFDETQSLYEFRKGD